MPKIYVAGPMRGIPFFNFPAFDAARDRLLGSGWEVISPADLDRAIGFDEKSFPDDYDWLDLNKIGFDLNSAVDRDVAAIKSCDAIYMLKGWDDSKGASAERGIAEWLGKPVFYEGEVTPIPDPGRITYPRPSFVSELQNAVAAGMAKGSDTPAIPEPPGPNGEGSTVVNEKGGKQSFIAARFDCIPPEVLRLLAQCLGFGARKYGKDNWRQIDLDDNLAHCLNHINEFRRGDKGEPHLVNSLARIVFALAIAVAEGLQEPDYNHPEMK